MPLLKLPDALKALPIFTIHADNVAAVSKLLDMTTLVTLLVPASETSAVSAPAETMSLQDLSIDALKVGSMTLSGLQLWIV